MHTHNYISYWLLLILFSITLHAEWSEEKMQYYCNNGDIQECVNLGIYDENRGNYISAFNKYEKGCKNDFSSACHNLGRLYKYGFGVQQNFQISNQYYRKSCELNSPKGCYALATSYENGQGIEQDYQKAVFFHDKSCNLGEAQGCAALAWFNKKGIGTEKNFQKSYYYYNIACNQNIAQACSGLAGFYFPGNEYNTVNSDYTKSINLFHKACNLGHEKSCDILKQLNAK